MEFVFTPIIIIKIDGLDGYIVRNTTDMPRKCKVMDTRMNVGGLNVGYIYILLFVGFDALQGHT